MFGRSIFFATVGVALALLGSSFFLDRLPAPAPVVAAPAPAAQNPVGFAAEAPPFAPPQR